MIPETINQTLPRYRYYKVAPAAEPTGTFLYVGAKAGEADRLSAWFGKTLGVSSFDGLTLRFSVAKDVEQIPQLVIIDTRCSMNELANLRQMIRKSPLLRGVTLIMNEARLSTTERQAIISARLVDDMIDLRADMEPQVSRVRFERDTKWASAIEPTTVRVETGSRPAFSTKALFKRIFDLTCAFGLILVFLPVMLLIAIAIKVESKGPVFYNSYRAGRGFRIFKFFKFRTMKVGADRMVQSMVHLNKYNTSNGAVFFKVNNDLRITRVGRILRSTGLDELPQLFNVILGDMSVVGNRPLPLYEANTLTTDDWAERFTAPAGITGLWQVREKLSNVLNSEDRIATDIYYSRHHNIFMDVRIMFQTARFMVKEMFGSSSIAIRKVAPENKLKPELVA
jgi:lipopolysaccharide/colanic/teichoic acid biosynthesis glycosyltransferase